MTLHEQVNALPGRRTYASVNLSAIQHNVREMKRVIAGDSAVAAVVKADAYGHGAVPVARAALDAGASVLCVAMAEEAVPLREAGISAPILVIGPSNRQQLRLGLALDLDLCVFDEAALRILEEEAVLTGRDARIHLKIDTGMGRIGVRPGPELNSFLTAFRNMSHVELAGVFTHLAQADLYNDTAPSLDQVHLFEQAVRDVRKAGHAPVVHVSNSAAAQNLPDLDLGFVRFGISLYGYQAGEGIPERQLDLKIAMEVKAEVSYVKDVPAGTAIGYGASYVLADASKIATVQIGYGDGYSRLLSNSGFMIAGPESGADFAPVVGRVCMDMTMIDVSGLADIRSGDIVTVMGCAGNVRYDAENIARACGTISYEVLCDFTSRVPRLYWEGNDG